MNSSDPIKAAKAELRQQLRARRQLITEHEAAAAGVKLLAQLQPLVTTAAVIAVYDALPGEISLQPLISYGLAQGWQMVRPIASRASRHLRFERVESSSPGAIFRQPDYQLIAEVKWYNLDLVLVPLVAVDRYGFRLGQGGGYYDTTFATSTAPQVLCGVGYDWQLLAEVPHAAWDLRLDYLATDQQFLKF